MIEIKMYPASEGDAFLISFGDNQEVNILIDMGLTDTYKNHIRNDLISLKNKNRKIDLLVITHVDQDHIQGAISFLEENGNEQKIIEVSEVWHNSYRHLQFEKEKQHINSDERISLEQIKLQNQSKINTGESNITVKQGSTLASLLFKYNYNWNSSFNNKAICIDNDSLVDLPNINIKLLSPDNKKLNSLSRTWLKHLESISYNFSISDDIVFDDAYELYIKNQKDSVVAYNDTSQSTNIFNIENLANLEGKDTSKTNGSSISFIIEYDDKKLLFLADSHNDIIINELSSLKDNGYELDFEVVKASHHGSKNNTSKKLLNLISSKRYLISTSGAKHAHPDIETIAKIATTNDSKEILTNYLHEKLSIFNNEYLENKHNYKVKHCNIINIT